MAVTKTVLVMLETVSRTSAGSNSYGSVSVAMHFNFDVANNDFCVLDTLWKLMCIHTALKHAHFNGPFYKAAMYIHAHTS